MGDPGTHKGAASFLEDRVVVLPVVQILGDQAAYRPMSHCSLSGELFHVTDSSLFLRAHPKLSFSWVLIRSAR